MSRSGGGGMGDVKYWDSSYAKVGSAHTRKDVVDAGTRYAGTYTWYLGTALQDILGHLMRK